MWRVTAVGAQKPTALLSTTTMVIYMTLLLTTMCCCCSADVTHDISGDAGRHVLLPCNCSGHYDKVIWQTDSHKVVYSQNRNQVDAQYQDRSQIVLEDKTNCSLWLSNISLVDSGVYDCYMIQKINRAKHPTKRATVNLTVIEKRSDEPTAAEKFGVDLKNELSVGIPILLVALTVALGWIITRRFRKQQRRNRVPNTDYEDEPSKPEEV